MKQYFLMAETQNAPNAIYQAACSIINGLDKQIINDDDVDDLLKFLSKMAEIHNKKFPRCRPIKVYKSYYGDRGWIGFVPQEGGIVCKATLTLIEVKGYYERKF